MAKKSKAKSKKNNNLMMWVFVALFLLIVISIAVILTLNNGNNPNNNAAFFNSDGSKYVVAADVENFKGNEKVVGAYDVYYYSGDTITDHKAYYEFIDAEAAEEALPQYETLIDNDIESVNVDGKYIVIKATPAQYEKITLEQVKRWSSVNSEDE